MLFSLESLQRRERHIPFKKTSSFLGNTLVFIFLAFLLQSTSKSDIHRNTTLGKNLLHKVQTLPDFGSYPLYFIPNLGQYDENALYCVQTQAYTAWITKKGLLFQEGGRAFSLEFHDIDPGVDIRPCERTDYKVNFITGENANDWKTGVPTYDGIWLKKIYKGVDCLISGFEGMIQYDWHVKSWGTPDNIRMEFKNVKRTKKESNGNLIVETELGRFVHRKPIAFQSINSEKVAVEVSFRKLGENAYGFRTDEYDKNYDLVIDPLIFVYATYLGGSANEYASAVAVDSSGAAYITGKTSSRNFPLKNGFQGDRAIEDAFVTKISPTGKSLRYSTYLGGSGYDYALDIAVDNSGCAYITGGTWSFDFPVKKAFQEDQPERDAFVTKLSPEGDSLVFSTYLGGNDWDESYGIAVSPFGEACVVGRTESTNFPSVDAIHEKQPRGDAFVTKFSSSGKNIVFSTFIGGSELDYASGVCVDQQGSIYIAGGTRSPDFPLVNPFRTKRGGEDAFILKLPPQGTVLSYATCLGGKGEDVANSVAVDEAGNIFVTGHTSSTNFPLKNPFQKDCQGVDAFVTKINPLGDSLIYSTYLGGEDKDIAWEISVDATGSACVAGETESPDFPTKHPRRKNKAGTDGFVTKLSASGDALEFSTYLGGNGEDYAYSVALDKEGYPIVVGWTGSTDFPTLIPIQPNQPEWDAFVVKLAYGRQPSIPSSPTPTDGERGIIRTPTLAWNSKNADSFDIFGGNNRSKLRKLATVKQPQYKILDPLPPDKKFYWRVVARNIFGSREGPEWNFKTTF